MQQTNVTVYWVGMGKDVSNHCSHCVTCQRAKATATYLAPLQPVVVSRPWELVAVDVLKVPMSPQGNQYMLVVQDYFSKWPFAVPLPDQTANKMGLLRTTCSHWLALPRGYTLTSSETLRARTQQTVQDLWSKQGPNNNLSPDE